MRELEMHVTNGLVFLAVAELDGETYFSAWGHNGLFRLHKDGTTDFIMLFDKYGDVSPKHEFAIGMRDTIMFIPSNSEQEIALFTPKDKKIEYLKYPAPEKECMYRPFWGYVKRNTTIYLLPNSYDAVLAFDQNSKEFFRYVLPVERETFCEEKSVFIGGITVDNIVYFCPWNSSEMISFNLETSEFEILGETAKTTYRHIFHIEGKLYLIPRILTLDIMVYDLQKKELQKRVMPSAIQGICICAFADDKGNIYLLPNNENVVWIWNPLSDTLDSADIKIGQNAPDNGLCFNESRDLWKGKIIFTALETLSSLLFDGKEFKTFDIDRGKGLFLDILISMMENHDGTTIYEY